MSYRMKSFMMFVAMLFIGLNSSGCVSEYSQVLLTPVVKNVESNLSHEPAQEEIKAKEAAEAQRQAEIQKEEQEMEARAQVRKAFEKKWKNIDVAGAPEYMTSVDRYFGGRNASKFTKVKTVLIKEPRGYFGCSYYKVYVNGKFVAYTTSYALTIRDACFKRGYYVFEVWGRASDGRKILGYGFFPNNNAEQFDNLMK